MTATTGAQVLAEEIVEVHGGAARWHRFAAVDVRFSARGLAFLSKGQPATLSTVVGRFGTTSQSVSLHGQMPHPWRYEADGNAGLLADVQALMGGRRLWWSTRDVASFAAVAMWTYLNLPFLLLDPRFGLEMLPTDGRQFRRLRVCFPSELATHSALHILHVDARGLIRRHDYTARAIGRWAVGSQELGGYREFDGILFATRRRVTPRVLGYALPAPTLVRIEVEDLQFVANGRPSSVIPVPEQFGAAVGIHRAAGHLHL